MARRNFLGLGAGAASGAALGACGGDSAALAHDLPARAGTVPGWNRLALQAIASTPSASSTAARTLAILHTCMYDAWAAYDDAARQTVHGVAVRLPRSERSAASKASAMSHAAYSTLCRRFPAHKPVFDAHLAALGLDPAQASGELTPAGIGRTQAQRLADAPGAPGEPSAGLPDGADAPCAGAGLAHWCRLAHGVSARDRHDDDRDVLLFFVLAQALADAAMVARDARQAAAGPAQLCAHSALGAAAAEALRRFTGSDRLIAAPAGHAAALAVDSGKAPADLLPAWASFSAAAAQAPLACVHDGMCCAAAHAAGLDLGRQAGAQAFDKARRYWQGKL